MNIKLVAFVLNKENKFLIEKTDEGYKLLEGNLNEGERIEDGYKRFILDNTGLTIEMLGIIYTYNFDNVDQISIAFRCTPLVKYKPTKELPSIYCWTTEKESKSLDVIFPYREIITRERF